MKIIIPMAGMGKRMRPHTLTIPKPLIRIAGKPIVQRLVEGIASMCKEKIDEIAFIIGDFGKEVETQLLDIAGQIGTKGKIYYQENPLGTAHAILCAADSLNDKVVVAFADTLFFADFILDDTKDSIVWVHKVQNPAAFGVVKTNNEGIITSIVEKPKTFVSDLAIIGIYYFKDGAYLKSELQYLVDNNIQKGGEFQLTDALDNMMKKGSQLYIGKVNEWLDCGNKDATVFTNQRILEFSKQQKLVSESVVIENSIIIQPCYLGENVRITDSIIGPHVSVGENTVINYSVITNSIIQSNTKISCVNLDNSMIGNYVEYFGGKKEVSIGDYTVLS
ncbi:MAG TPA: sugar phosphate nucleotidyltransferase [Bacteroidales bacterium]|nr:sugar phosphate nucleotidyltransferase [Bacteroidales bacterium]HPS16637.1 sugar phosphate nucleotidyltransferase [Bacteroidales bacterium]